MGNVNPDLGDVAQEGNYAKKHLPIAIGSHHSSVRNLGEYFRAVYHQMRLEEEVKVTSLRVRQGKSGERKLTAAVEERAKNISDKGAEVQGGSRHNERS
ncbi:hypothetical protein BOTCAL_0012g00050 [Botryotinia calthae]|uniref:Uncharacterized protein n=1 Tax=Botryotinia calthae TaxID=38488 RepID=A0A4Y8DFZ2_9HELO|nr:hypothetical protein BOTCAL_0012g00050 [Botryotinia calthae]